ncbi:hypothetical protein TNIN_400001 [Trichonephila inaurata madagascariensis]|uniref:Uncharacterized protein n=1 Tax=Trichonephila inaurata madagascariensis TaxID=2747483 RepID=A0A8X7BQV8_9ARAC|nr:hypothetical protein TNIN_400001 [Trichonephila inaurata madagascariensis]
MTKRLLRSLSDRCISDQRKLDVLRITELSYSKNRLDNVFITCLSLGIIEVATDTKQNRVHYCPPQRPVVKKEKVDNGVNECVDKIEDEIAECLVEGISEALSSILESPNELDADSIKCSMYNSVANCIINQIRTNCRIEASNKSLKAVLNIPDDIQESCNEPATNDVLQALFDRRKK